MFPVDTTSRICPQLAYTCACAADADEDEDGVPRVAYCNQSFLKLIVAAAAGPSSVVGRRLDDVITSAEPLQLSRNGPDSSIQVVSLHST